MNEKELQLIQEGGEGYKKPFFQKESFTKEIRVKYIEKMGTGINKMRRLVAEVGLPPIEFEFGTFFTAIFRRPARIEPIVFDERGGVFGGVFGGVNEKVAERMGKVIKALCGGQLNISQLTVMTGIPKRTLERDIALLKDKGFTEFEGAPKTGRYVLTEKGKKIMVKFNEVSVR